MNYIGPGKKININKSVIKNVNNVAKKYRPLINSKEIYAWGISDKNRFKNYCSNKGDLIAIYSSDDEDAVLYIGRVIEKFTSEDMSIELWGKKSIKNQIVLFEMEKKVNIKKERIYEIFNDGNVLQSMKSTNIDLKNIHKLEYQVSLDIKHNEELSEKLIRKVKEMKLNPQSSFNIKLGGERNNKSKNKLEKKNKKIHSETNDNYPKELVGYYGEQIIFSYLKILEEVSKNAAFLKKLEFQEGEKIEEINWYNENVIIENGKFEDKSVGKGHDIKIITNKRVIKLEVKSSIHSVNMIYLSYNELLDMKYLNQNENSYIIIVGKILEEKEITVIKNFSELYSDEIIKIIIRQTVEVSKIPSRYIA